MHQHELQQAAHLGGVRERYACLILKLPRERDSPIGRPDCQRLVTSCLLPLCIGARGERYRDIKGHHLITLNKLNRTPHPRNHSFL